MDELVRVPVSAETLAPHGTTNAYVAGIRGGVLVDPATRSQTLDREVDRRTVAHLFVTHTHPDHVGAVAHYADTTDATVWARAGREARFERATGVAPDRTFSEGTVLRTSDERQLRIVETPGHAHDHVAVVVPTVGTLVGDLAVASGSVLVDGDEGDMRAYLTSLRRLYASDPPAMFPGHGPVIDDSRAVIRRLIDHRLSREERVLAAVRAGARTAEEIVDAAYEKDLTGVRALAARTTVAHLEKLAVEGKVHWNGDSVTAT